MQIQRTAVSLLVGILFALFSLEALAETSSPMKIGAFDSNEVIALSKAGQEAENAIKVKVLEMKEQLQTDEMSYMQMREQFEKNMENWNDIFRERKKREIEKKGSELGEKKKDFDLEIKIFRNEKLAPIYLEMEKVIPLISKQLGLSLVLDKSIIGLKATTGIFYADTIDIGTEIRKELDKQMTK